MWNLAAHIPPDHRFSRMHHGERELIDHILHSHALIDHIGGGDITTGPGATPSITDNPTHAAMRPPPTTVPSSRQSPRSPPDSGRENPTQPQPPRRLLEPAAAPRAMDADNLEAGRPLALT